MRLRLDRFASPIGIILLVSDDEGALRALDFEDYEPRMRTLLRRHYGEVELRDGAAPKDARRALDGYFGDPMYGGNKDMAAWKMIGYPGVRADFTDWVDKPSRYPYGPVSIYGRRG